MKLAVIAAGVACLCASSAFAGCAPDVVDFRWPGGKAHFSVEIADDAKERAKGLMFREKLAVGAGMLFAYDNPGTVAFWMKNTPLPLDLVFVGADGRVRHIAANAIPFDETAIPGGDGIQFVLEINGGLAGRLGLDEGAEMRHPLVDPALAVWPCATP